MHRLLLSALLTMTLALPVFAQDDENEETADTETETEQTLDESDLDDQTYGEVDEDDFEASEDVAADQSVAYPTDI